MYPSEIVADTIIPNFANQYIFLYLCKDFKEKMGIEYNDLIIRLKENIESLIDQNKALKRENKRLTDELDQKEQALMLAHKNILDLKSDYDNLRSARALAKNEDDVFFTQQRLSKLVREINKCIALLNQQQ